LGDENGEVCSLIVSARDVTEQETRNRILNAILENTMDLLFMKDRDGEYIIVSQGFRDLFDLQEGEIIDGTDEDLLPPEQASVVRQNDREVIERGKPVETEGRIVNDLIQVSFSVFVLLVVLVLIGYVARTAIGVFVQDEMDKFLEKIPLVRVIYKATKTGIEAMAGGKKGLKKPVKLGFGGCRLTVFKTGGKTKEGRETVFLPTAPNPTTGFVVGLPSSVSL